MSLSLMSNHEYCNDPGLTFKVIEEWTRMEPNFGEIAYVCIRGFDFLLLTKLLTN